MKKGIWGFTLIELLIVISVVGILSTIGIVSYGNIQEKSHDKQREVRVAIIKDALEKYYQDNGEYPACSAIANPVSIETAANVLELADPNVLTAPTAAKGTNSISCSASDPVADTYNYTGGTGFAIKYLVDETDTVDVENGQHGNPLSAPSNVSATSSSPTEATVTWDGVVGAVSYNVETATNSGFTGSTFTNGVTGTSKTVTGLTANQTYYFRLYSVSAAAVVSNASSTASVSTVLPVPADPSAPAIAVVLNGANVQATVTPVSCTGSTAQYGVRSRTNDGTWGSYSAWNTTLVFTQVAADGTKYGYQAQARCYESGTNYSGTVAGTESTYIDPIVAPSAPVVAANTVTTTTTWSWPAVTCTGGSARYQYNYTISPSGYNSGWVSNGTSLNVAFTTDTEEQTYTVAVQAQCYNTYSTSAWSASGSANYTRPVVLGSWKQLSYMYYHVCAINTSNNAYCWGYNSYGGVGDNTIVDKLVPTAVVNTGVLSGKTIKSIAAGAYHACVIASDDKVYCWGRDNYGQLGNNSSLTDSLVPVAVSTTGVLSGKTVKAISAGNHHTCVIASDDKLYCWGYNNHGQLGDNSITNRATPVAVNTSGVFSGKTILSVESGYSDTCAIASDNKAYCWGYNNHGQVGDNTQDIDRTVPTAVYTSGVLSGKTIKVISSGQYTTCVIASDNNAYCWGINSDGQVGDGTVGIDRLAPTTVINNGVLSGKTLKAISINYDHTCAIASDNKAYCWGQGDYGALGDGSIISKLEPMMPSTSGVLAGRTLLTIFAGNRSTCALATNNKIYCWGDGAYGKLGVGTLDDTLVPIEVNNL